MPPWTRLTSFVETYRERLAAAILPSPTSARSPLCALQADRLDRRAQLQRPHGAPSRCRPAVSASTREPLIELDPSSPSHKARHPDDQLAPRQRPALRRLRARLARGEQCDADCTQPLYKASRSMCGERSAAAIWRNHAPRSIQRCDPVIRCAAIAAYYGRPGRTTAQGDRAAAAGADPGPLGELSVNRDSPKRLKAVRTKSRVRPNRCTPAVPLTRILGAHGPAHARAVGSPAATQVETGPARVESRTGPGRAQPPAQHTKRSRPSRSRPQRPQNRVSMAAGSSAPRCLAPAASAADRGPQPAQNTGRSGTIRSAREHPAERLWPWPINRVKRPNARSRHRGSQRIPR